MKIVCIDPCVLDKVNYKKYKVYTYSKINGYNGIYAMYNINNVYLGRINVKYIISNFITYEEYNQELRSVDYLFDILLSV